MSRTRRRNGKRDKGCSCWLCRWPKASAAWLKARRVSGCAIPKPKGAK